MNLRQRQAEPIIPSDLSAEQALAMFELLECLRDQLFEQYGPEIQCAMRQQQCTHQDPGPLDDPPF
jgi:hypothetical protein